MKRTMVFIGMVVGMLLGAMPLPSDVHAQVSVTFHSGATGTADGTSLDVTLFSNIGVQVSGTFVGTVSFEGRMEDASNWELLRCINTASGSVVTAMATTGIVQCPNPGIKLFRARVSAYTSGTIIVYGLGTSAAAPASLSAGGSGTSTGIQNGTSFPSGPVVGDMFFITNDSAQGACDGAGGLVGTLCRWDGSNWVAVNFVPEADTLGSVTARDNTSTGNDESNPFEILGTGAQASYGLSFDRTSTGESRIRCKEAAGLNKCDYYRQIDSGFKGGFKDSSNNIDFEYTESTGKISAITVDAEDSGVVSTRPFYWDLDFCGINPADSSLGHIWNKDPLSTSPTLTAKAGTNRRTCVLTFPDSDGDYGIGITRQLPAGFTGSFDADIWWDTTGTGNARFQIATKCYADDEADDASNNTASVVTAAAGTSGRPNKQTITGITITGCAADELMRIRFFRNRTEGSDTLNAALNVEKIRFKGRTTK